MLEKEPLSLERHLASAVSGSVVQSGMWVYLFAMPLYSFYGMKSYTARHTYILTNVWWWRWWRPRQAPYHVTPSTNSSSHCCAVFGNQFLMSFFTWPFVCILLYFVVCALFSSSFFVFDFCFLFALNIFRGLFALNFPGIQCCPE